MRAPGLTLGLWLALSALPAAAAERVSLGAGAAGGYDGNVFFDSAPTAQVEAFVAESELFATWAADATQVAGGISGSAALQSFHADEELGTAQRVSLAGWAALYPRAWMKFGLSAGAERTAVRGADLSFLAYDLGEAYAEGLWLGETAAFGLWSSAERSRYDSLFTGTERRIDDRLSLGAIASVDAFGTWRLEPAFTWAPSNVEELTYGGPEGYLVWIRPLWPDATLRLSGETRYRRFSNVDRVDVQWRARALFRHYLSDRASVAAWGLRVVNGSTDASAAYAWTTGGVSVEFEQVWGW